MVDADEMDVEDKLDRVTLRVGEKAFRRLEYDRRFRPLKRKERGYVKKEVRYCEIEPRTRKRLRGSPVLSAGAVSQRLGNAAYVRRVRGMADALGISWREAQKADKAMKNVPLRLKRRIYEALVNEAVAEYGARSEATREERRERRRIHKLHKKGVHVD